MSSALRIHIKTHWLGYVVALVIGCVMILPNVWLKMELGDAYQGVNIADIDNDIYYYARIKAAYDGDAKITEATMDIENADELPYTAPPLGENIVAWTARLFGIEPHQMIVVGNVLYTFFLALVLYALAWTITKSKAVAILTPLVILLASNVVFYPKNIWYVIFDQEKIWHNVYNRPIHPQISFLFFYTWLWVMVKVAKNFSPLTRGEMQEGGVGAQSTPSPHLPLSRGGNVIITAGLLFGAMFYVYPYSWTYAGAILFVCAVFSLVRRDYILFRRFFIIGFIGLLVSIPNWINYYHFILHPLYEVMQKRFVLFPSRAPVWSTLLAMDVLLISAMLYLRRRSLSSASDRSDKSDRFDKSLFIFLFSAVVAGFVVINQQVITGVRLFPGHWHWYYVVPLSIFLFIYFLCFWIPNLLRDDRIKKTLIFVCAAAIGMFSVSDGVLAQRTYYEDNRNNYSYYQRYAEVYQWLNQHTLSGSVVLSDPEFSERLPLWTSNFRYLFRPTDELFFVPTERIKHAFFTKLYLQGVTGETVDQYITQDTYELKEIFFGYYRRYAERCTECYSKEELDTLRHEYRGFVSGDFEKLLKTYKIDYAVWDANKYPEYRFDTYEFMEFVTERNGLKIYKVR